ncbi:DUF7289 family protein [Haloferacaceae archaeon DSL9]
MTAAIGNGTVGRGDASVIGVVLLLGLVMTATTLVVALGGATLGDAQRSAELQRAEHVLTQFDARAGAVALGGGDPRTVRIGHGGDGVYAVDPDAGRLLVEHVNHTGEGDDDIEALYDGPLGAVIYRSGETTVAYQGGGVWRERDGRATMVSPPEFHYRGETLTLPIVRTTGDGRAAGRVDATISQMRMNRVYPAADGRYSTGESYRNPVRNGTVRITVESDYYRGWAAYFETRTSGAVTVDERARRASVVLETVDRGGTVTLPEKGGSVPVRGQAAGYAVTDFGVEAALGDGTPNNMDVSFYARTDRRDFEVLVGIPPGLGNNYCEASDDHRLAVEAYYRDRDGDEGIHHWRNDDVSLHDGAIRLDCDREDPALVADFTDNTPMTFASGGMPNDRATALDWSGETATAAGLADERTGETATAAGLADERTGETIRVSEDTNEVQELGFLTVHYLAQLAPEYELTVHHGPGNRGSAHLDTNRSRLTFEYESGGNRYLTYLHITENEIRVELR